MSEPSISVDDVTQWLEDWNGDPGCRIMMKKIAEIASKSDNDSV